MSRSLDDQNGDRGDVAPPACDYPVSAGEMPVRCSVCGRDISVRDKDLGGLCRECHDNPKDPRQPAGGPAPLSGGYSFDKDEHGHGSYPRGEGGTSVQDNTAHNREVARGDAAHAAGKHEQGDKHYAHAAAVGAGLKVHESHAGTQLQHPNGRQALIKSVAQIRSEGNAKSVAGLPSSVTHVSYVSPKTGSVSQATAHASYRGAVEHAVGRLTK